MSLLSSLSIFRTATLKYLPSKFTKGVYQDISFYLYLFELTMPSYFFSLYYLIENWIIESNNVIILDSIPPFCQDFLCWLLNGHRLSPL